VIAQLFCLTNADNSDEIFAYGIEISEDEIIEAVTYHRDPDTHRIVFGLHRSADSALARYGRMLPLALYFND
jgi:hypothetical protein